jgi:hypothetical protein
VLPEMITLRRAIYRRPDLSGRQKATLARLIDYLTPFEPEKVHPPVNILSKSLNPPRYDKVSDKGVTDRPFRSIILRS